ncbi:LysR family transcriptional regulator [Methylobacterium longum]|uniref:LysR family transcriptional regulator n=1 Tax=Methylobacterium longum TaxID=767694 RepID=A0ABT8AJ79_9HYPH|nr:LysR family transcriptional regulator [Methylobacterium longum]MDN3569917.1 LysR family transcriptional regulator [Methylobacterium longum]GJE14305.1 HTH-type transcriptional regulator HdfR [Methylobacterium longum]
MAVNIKQLETFLEIARCGSFTGAADRLNATISTVSARIQGLEQDLGVLLFDRVARKASLTAKGRELQIYAERAVAACSEIRLKVGSGEALSGCVRLGVAELVAVTWLPTFVELIHQNYPRLTLELSVALTADLQHMMAHGEIDLALMPSTCFDPDISARSLGYVRFAWMAGQAISLPDRVIEPSDFRDLRVLSLGKNSFHYRTVEGWLSARGHEVRAVDLCNSMGAIASLTKAGIGVSLLPVQCYQPEIASGVFRVLATHPEGPLVEFFSVHASNSSTSIPSLMAEMAVRASTFEV